jgi:hypothetical protein
VYMRMPSLIEVACHFNRSFDIYTVYVLNKQLSLPLGSTKIG